jgi:outer membrane protein
MRLQKFILAGIIILIIGVAALAAYVYQHQAPSIVYIRSQELIEKYRGTIEARAEFEKRKTQMMANVDSLRQDFQRAGSRYMGQAAGMSPAKRAEEERRLGQQQQQVMQYENAIDEKINEEDQKMMQQVLNQVNSFVEMYALREGYDYILGTTLSGNLLFGNKSLDVTDAVVKELNEQYKGK